MKVVAGQVFLEESNGLGVDPQGSVRLLSGLDEIVRILPVVEHGHKPHDRSYRNPGGLLDLVCGTLWRGCALRSRALRSPLRCFFSHETLPGLWRCDQLKFPALH